MANENEKPQYIEKRVADAMLAELQTAMQNTINALMQRGVDQAGTIETLRQHGTALEAALAQEREVIKPALIAEVERLKAKYEPQSLVVTIEDEAERQPLPN